MRLIIWTVVLIVGCGSSGESQDRETVDLGGSGPGVPEDTGGGEDTGDAEVPAYLLPGNFTGEMETTYVYIPSWSPEDTIEDTCTGAASLALDDALVVSGEGDCQFGFWGMEFLMEGQQTGSAIEGLLFSEVGGDRVDTPFTGTRDETSISLTFDTVHEADGESVQLMGTVTVMVDQ
jgi:hypothetical protein